MKDKEKNNSIDSSVAERLREMGYNNSAKYVEKYGIKNVNPSLWTLGSQEADDFYGMCLSQGCTWDEIVKFPKDAIF